MGKRPVGQCDGCAQLRAFSRVFDRQLCDACVRALPEPPASENQISYLRDLGVEIPTFLGRRDASGLISEAAGRRPATDKQLAYLRHLRVPFELPLCQGSATELIDQAHAARDYVWELFNEEFQPKRGPKGRFEKGSLRGVTNGFADRQTDRMYRFILSDPKLRAAVLVVVDNRDRRTIPRDATRAAVVSHLREPAIDLFSWVNKLLGWLFKPKTWGGKLV